MPALGRLPATVSTKGQVILPNAVRNRKMWRSGTPLIVEDTADGTLFWPAPALQFTPPEDVFGSLTYATIPKILKAMKFAIATDVKRHDRNRR